MKHILNKLETFLDKNSILIDEPMKRHTSFKVGGPVDILLIPKTEKEIKDILILLNNENFPFYIMGNGSNLLVSDKGVRGAVIKLSENYSNCEVQDSILNAQSGILLSELSQIALSNNLGGFEFASGIPGTLGGAVTMNAGAYGGEMKDILISAHVIDKKGNIFEIVNGNLQLGYRTSAIQVQDLIILSSKVKLSECSNNEIKEKMDDLEYKRKSKQPLEWPSAGSTFKRPEGYFAGKLIEDSGLRGFQLGGAQVSQKHCGFIINKDNATASDVINLIHHVQKVVYENFGVKLDTEVKQLGEF
ncbi:UDP-N-acetylmuramate dehydrogenase [Alkalibaculum sp. M08DMB]|uniref:UDP-N-acetylenolpyruvoylglucosamine reductase n=1 Tax=Alkalibaculum sporogenes TaxID=2655001 RepID=A0A6A7KAF7_9FIRM|nr:UDP-N-acetylmuramate dehydrogenase [Alkalibaculum sporogenes]MPW26376.1 UDP-N-acetylmuramate dehydrogenase [Alkalibaculum sporogenes]